MPLTSHFKITTRVHTPEQLRHELMREVLLTKIQAADGYNIVAITAPAGYGKTTFLGQVIRNSDRPTAWLELTPDDTATAHLAISLLHTIQREIPNANFEHFKTVLERQQQAELIDTENLARAFARDLDALEVNLNIVIDETERLSAESGRWVSILAKHLTEGHCLFLSGYDLTHLSLARSIAKGTAMLIDQNDLRFTFDEAATYLGNRSFGGEVRTAYNACDGWAAGLALIAVGASPNLTPTALIEEALEQLPTDLQQALPEAAVLELWSEQYAKALGCALPTDWLRILHRSGLPITPLGAEIFKPHHLLREVLEKQLRQKPTRHAELHVQAGDTAARQDNLMQAFDHYLAAQAKESLLETAKRIVARFRIAGEHHLIKRVLERLPEAWLDLELETALYLAWTLTGETTRGETRLRQLHAKGQANATALGALARLAGRQGNPTEELTLAEAALQLGGPPREMALCRRLRGFALINLQRAEEALEIANQEILIAKQEHDDYALGLALGLAHRAYYALGQRTACIRILKECIELYQTLGIPKQTLSFRNDIADFLRFEGRFVEAFEELGHAFAIVGNDDTEERAFMFETSADLHYWSGNMTEAKATYEKARDLASKFHFEPLELRIQLKLVELHVFNRNVPTAQVLLDRVSAVLNTRSILIQDLHFAQGIIAFFDGNLDAAQTHFQEVRRSNEPSHHARSSAYLAQIAWQQQTFSQTQAQSWLGALDQLGSDYVINLDIEHTRPALTHALERGWFPHERFGPYRLSASNIEPAEVWQPQKFKLEITTLGTRHVNLNGQKLEIPLAKSFELLVRLALHGPASRSDLINALWDGSLETRHTEYFKVAVRRLRAYLESLLDIDFNPLPFTDQYMLSEQFDIVLDTQLIERAIETGNKTKLERLLHRKPGEFLKGIDSEWILEKRQQIAADVVEAYALLGELSTHPHAQEAFKRGLELDALNERCLIGLIKCYVERSETHNAQRTYQRYSRQLWEDMHLKPSSELNQALQAIGLTLSSPPIPFNQS
jgi:LuxR family transcriptional regulator, maltose regulon positive regulatory protein